LATIYVFLLSHDDMKSLYNSQARVIYFILFILSFVDGYSCVCVDSDRSTVLAHGQSTFGKYWARHHLLKMVPKRDVS